MALTQQQRTEIYTNLADTVGEQGAEYLMAQQPPGGWEQFATKSDLKASIVELQSKMDSQFAQIREQLAEIQKQFAAIDTRFAEIDTRFAAIDTRFAAIDTRFAEIDTRFAELIARRSRDVWAFIAAVAVMTVSICGSVFLAA